MFGADVNSFNAQQETPIDIANQLNSMVRCSICMNKFDIVYIKLMRQCHLCLYASLHYKQRGWSNTIDLAGSYCYFVIKLQRSSTQLCEY